MRSSRWIAYLLAASLAVTVFFVSAATAHAKPRLSTLIAEMQVALWKCQDQRAVPRTAVSVAPWALPKSNAYRKWTLQLWQQRKKACLIELQEQKRQWNWQEWLPTVWRAIAICETPRGGAMNWQHNSGTYQGAFGFYHGSWDDYKLPGYPDEAYDATPWQQYQVALTIHARYGFSGWGCYTHGGYRSHM